MENLFLTDHYILARKPENGSYTDTILCAPIVDVVLLSILIPISLDELSVQERETDVEVNEAAFRLLGADGVVVSVVFSIIEYNPVYC